MANAQHSAPSNEQPSLAGLIRKVDRLDPEFFPQKDSEYWASWAGSPPTKHRIIAATTQRIAIRDTDWRLYIELVRIPFQWEAMIATSKFRVLQADKELDIALLSAYIKALEMAA